MKVLSLKSIVLGAVLASVSIQPISAADGWGKLFVPAVFALGTVGLMVRDHIVNGPKRENVRKMHKDQEEALKTQGQQALRLDNMESKTVAKDQLPTHCCSCEDRNQAGKKFDPVLNKDFIYFYTLACCSQKNPGTVYCSDCLFKRTQHKQNLENQTFECIACLETCADTDITVHVYSPNIPNVHEPVQAKEEDLKQEDKQAEKVSSDTEKAKEQPKKTLWGVFKSFFEPRTNVDVPYGLANFGNSCFMNATMQAVLRIPAFQSVLKDEMAKCDDQTCKQITSFWDGLLQKKNVNGAYGQFHEALRKEIFPEDDDTRQQDAQEFLSMLLFNRLYDFKSLKPLFDKTCMLQTRDLFCCQHGHKRLAERAEPRHIISLSLPEQISVADVMAQIKDDMSDVEVDAILTQAHSQVVHYRLQELMDGYFRVAPVENIACQKPGCGNTNSTKKSMIKQVPPVLIVHLSRFAFEQGSTEKINNVAVSFPLQDLIVKGVDGSVNRYKLRSVINHHGQSANSGHYTAIVRGGKDDQVWTRYNDERVTDLQGDELASFITDTQDPYIFFYELQEQPQAEQEVNKNKLGKPRSLTV
ncbi:MAG: ubiquitin carboxyl-terminal hydrolase [Epsilonproteobacteria bacterium]|nr:ubiquitin carboxyl-terminal hydrolase [Campylobacterota bacterium]